MSSPNILLTRIDNRLVHGQVGVTWTSTIGANLLVVVDDVVANDDIQQKLMGITAETYGFGKVYVDDQDLADLRFIKQRGVNVFIQDVPGDQKEQIPD